MKAYPLFTPSMHPYVSAVATRSIEAAWRRLWNCHSGTPATRDVLDATAGTARSYTLLRGTSHASLPSECRTACPSDQQRLWHAAAEFQPATSGFIGWPGT